MGEFFVYILKSSACLTIFYLFYRLLLSRDTFHRFNRVALLGLILLSVVTPLCRIAVEQQEVVQQSILIPDHLQQITQGQTEMDIPIEQAIWLRGLFVLYICGAVFFFIKLIYSIICIFSLIKSGEVQQLENGRRLVIMSNTVSPFSWMNYIVISHKDLEESKNEILTHELAHINAYHSFDMLISGLCVIVHWFNPAVWLLKQELQNIHEYEADESVINQGIDAKKYQLLLIKKAVGSQRFTSMANSFNHSKLNKRITMMLKIKSSHWARLKYFYVLPLIAIAISAFAHPEISRELEKISKVKVIITNTIPQESDTGMTVAQQYSKMVRDSVTDRGSLISYSTSSFSQKNDSGTIIVRQSYEKVKDGVTIQSNIINIGTSSQLNKDTLASNLTSFFESKSGSIQKSKTVYSTNLAYKDPLFILDGVEFTAEDLKKIDVASIESMSVLKDKASTDVYGAKGKNGVIIIKTKKK